MIKKIFDEPGKRMDECRLTKVRKYKEEPNKAE